MTKLAADIITKSMYAQYDVDGNECLLLEMFVNHSKSSSALSAMDQWIVVKGQKIVKSQHLVGTFVANGRRVPY